MATIWGPNIVTDDLYLSVDAANAESYAPAGTIPQKSESIASAWTDQGSSQAYYSVIGDDDITLTSGTGWYGYFLSTVATTGYYTVAFEHSSDDPGTSGSYNFVIDNNGVQDNYYNTTILATTTVQTFTKTVDITSTGTSQMFVRRDYGTNIKVRNFRFYKSDSAGNSLKWHDLSGNGFDADVVNAPTFSSNNGGYFDFNGTNQYCDFGSSSTAWNLTNATWEGWFLNDQTTGGANTFMGTDYIIKWAIFMYGTSGTSDGRIRLDTPSTQQVSHYNCFTLDTWVHFAWTYAGGDIILYVNGSKVGSTDTGNSAIPTSTSNMYLAREVRGGYYWDGYISIARIYTKALTAAEILQNFNAHKGRYGL